LLTIDAYLNQTDPPQSTFKLGKNKSGEKWVFVDDFKGTTYATIRDFYTDKEGQLKPGKGTSGLQAPLVSRQELQCSDQFLTAKLGTYTGISLSLDQFGSLKDCWTELCAAVDDLKKK